MILNLLRGQVSCLVSLNSNMRRYKQVVEVTPAAVAPNLPSQMTFPTGLPHKQLCILFCQSFFWSYFSSSVHHVAMYIHKYAHNNS